MSITPSLNASYPALAHVGLPVGGFCSFLTRTTLNQKSGYQTIAMHIGHELFQAQGKLLETS
jgi:hypothetical protein